MKKVSKTTPSSSKKRSSLSQTSPASQMKSYRFRAETIEALQALTQAVNERTNIKISATAIIELLVLDAAKGDINRILKLIHSTK